MQHNLSPYMRRYRLPQLQFNWISKSNPERNNIKNFTRSSYDSLFSPMDMQSKLDFITIKNQQLLNKQVSLYIQYSLILLILLFFYTFIITLKTI